jgi:uncharacterized protein YlxW (UPF0749 family)
MALSTSTFLLALLRSNDAPLPSQKTLVHEILRDKQAELSMLADEISRLESTISSLRIKHAELASEMDQFSNILSLI